MVMVLKKHSILQTASFCFRGMVLKAVVLGLHSAGLDCERRKIQNYGVICFRWHLGVDGHNGFAAAIYSKENLLNNVLATIPSDLNRDEWVAALPRVLVAGVKRGLV
ncbi:putative protein phosphatase 2C 12 [Camellia lanceoleosa]|uniref:Uncharacterized protein n=1 Tax=Camellia lanceoleosa TaxID=1840588 RepID=A0ACC0H977_9ERIC|nr:putative protein phosphatase 2C 12 [Camellia lanceoleosa]